MISQTHLHCCRWPWPLFQLLHGSIALVSEAKKTVAKQLLGADISMLEVTTRRIRVMCDQDLRDVASSGVLRAGCLLHAILVSASRDLRLDAGELESLNSMIKSFLALKSRQFTGMIALIAVSFHVGFSDCSFSVLVLVRCSV